MVISVHRQVFAGGRFKLADHDRNDAASGFEVAEKFGVITLDLSVETGVETVGGVKHGRPQLTRSHRRLREWPNPSAGIVPDKIGA
jgi:hypothetical protein